MQLIKVESGSRKDIIADQSIVFKKAAVVEKRASKSGLSKS